MATGKTMTKTAGVSDDAVIKRTGKTWAQWLQVLDRLGAKQMKHREIAGWAEISGRIW